MDKQPQYKKEKFGSQCRVSQVTLEIENTFKNDSSQGRSGSMVNLQDSYMSMPSVFEYTHDGGRQAKSRINRLALLSPKLQGRQVSIQSSQQFELMNRRREMRSNSQPSIKDGKYLIRELRQIQKKMVRNHYDTQVSEPEDPNQMMKNVDNFYQQKATVLLNNNNQQINSAMNSFNVLSPMMQSLKMHNSTDSKVDVNFFQQEDGLNILSNQQKIDIQSESEDLSENQNNMVQMDQAVPHGGHADEEQGLDDMERRATSNERGTEDLSPRPVLNIVFSEQNINDDQDQVEELIGGQNHNFNPINNPILKSTKTLLKKSNPISSQMNIQENYQQEQPDGFLKKSPRNSILKMQQKSSFKGIKKYESSQSQSFKSNSSFKSDSDYTSSCPSSSEKSEENAMKRVKEMRMRRTGTQMHNQKDIFDCTCISTRQNDLLERVQQEQELSLKQLKNHINEMHPHTTNDELWPLFSDTGTFLNFSLLKDIPELLRDIGLGSSLYLLNLKAFGIIFLILSIINLPAMYFYASGQFSNSDGVAREIGFMEQISIANLGQHSISCSRMTIKENADLTDQNLFCPSGQIKTIVSFGLVKNVEKSCQEQRFQKSDSCSSEYDQNDKNSQFKKELVDQFDKECRNKSKCKIDLDIKNMGRSCSDMIAENIKSKKEQIFQVQFLCEMSSIKLLGSEKEISKSVFSLIILVLDLIGMLLLIIFINFISVISQQFSYQYDQKSIQLRHFTVRASALPKEIGQFKDEISIKFAIWKLIQDRFTDAKQIGMCDKSLDSTIVDINFGMQSFDIIMRLNKMNDLCSEIELQNIILNQSKNQKENEQIRSKIEKQISNLQEQYDHYQDKYYNMPISQAICHSKEGKLSKKIVDVYITFLTTEARNLVVDKLLRLDGAKTISFTRFDKKQQELERSHSVMLEKLQKLNSTSQSLTTSKVDARHSVQIQQKSPILLQLSDIQNKDASNSSLNPLKFKTVIEKRRKADLEVGMLQNDLERQLRKKFTPDRIEGDLKTEKPVDPEFILWENIGITKHSRKLRRNLSILVAIVIAAISLTIVLKFNEQVNKHKELSEFECLQNMIRKDHEDNDKLNCECLKQLNEQGLVKSMLNWNLFYSKNKGCSKWYINRKFINIILAYKRTVLVILTVIAEKVHIFMAQNEKHYSSASENYSLFVLLFIESYIGLGFLLIFVDSEYIFNFNLDQDWFSHNGATLYLIMTAYIISTKSIDIFEILIGAVRRFYDRGMTNKMNSKYVVDLPRTKQKRQNDLNQLYTGPQIKIGLKMSQVFIYTFITLTYSLALPFLYPLCSLFFFTTFWFEKICLIRTHQKTKVFNEYLPIESLKMFKYAVFVHFIFNLVLFYNTNLLDGTKFGQKDFEAIQIDPTRFQRLTRFEFVIMIVVFVLSMSAFIYMKLKGNIIATTLYDKIMSHQTGILKKTAAQNLQKSLILQMQNRRDSRCKHKVAAKENPVEELQSSPVVEKEEGCSHRDHDLIDGSTGMKISFLEKHQPKTNFSLNFYGDIYLNQLDKFHEKLTFQRQVAKEKIPDFKKEVRDNKIPVQRMASYLTFTNEIEHNKRLIMNQISKYYDKIIKEINVHGSDESAIQHAFIRDLQTMKLNNYKSVESDDESDNSQNSSNSSDVKSLSFSSDPSSQDHPQEAQQDNILQKQVTKIHKKQKFLDDKDKFYMKKLCYLMDRFNEKDLKQHYFTNNFRCSSSCQSYSVLDNPQFESATGACDRAEVLLSKPFIYDTDNHHHHHHHDSNSEENQDKEEEMVEKDDDVTPSQRDENSSLEKEDIEVKPLFDDPSNSAPKKSKVIQEVIVSTTQEVKAQDPVVKQPLCAQERKQCILRQATFNKNNKQSIFEEIAFYNIANQLRPDQVKELKELFLQLDKDKSGKVCVKEIKKALYEIEFGEALYDSLKFADINGDDEINLNEFLLGGIDFNVFVNEEWVQQAFDAYDKDGNGYISHEELQAILQKGNECTQLSKAEIETACKEFDKDGDNKITFLDFKIMMADLMKRHSKA